MSFANKFMAMPKISDMRFGALGWFLYFTRKWWEADREEREELYRQTKRILRMVRRLRFHAIDSFNFVSNGAIEHKYYNWRTPFKVVKAGGTKKFDLSVRNEKWFRCFMKWLELCKWADEHFRTCLLMDRYDYMPFQKNVNNVKDFFSDAALGYQIEYAKWVMEAYREVYGKRYKPLVKICNEPIRRAAADGVKIGKWHRSIVEHGLRVLEEDRYTKVRNVSIDISHTDYAMAFLVEEHVHGSVQLGDDRFLGSNGQRLIRPESHGITFAPSLIAYHYDSFLGSAWRIGEWHEDGASCVKIPDEHGKLKEVCPSGHQFGPFRISTPDEMEELAKQMWGRAKLAGKSSIFYMFPLETIVWNEVDEIWLEEYSREIINWRRARRLRKIHKRIYLHL